MDEKYEDGTGWTAGEKLSVKTAFEMDKEDESLTKWKKSLMKTTEVVPSPDGRKVIIKKLTISFPEDPHPPIVIELDTQDKIDKIEKSQEPLFTLKEGVKYNMTFTFNVYEDIVVGLSYVYVVKSKLKPVKLQHMVGSFAPQKESYDMTLDTMEAPKGLMFRGVYSAIGKFGDDDQNTHLIFSYKFKIDKNW